MRPFIPSDEFTWRGARLGNARFDFAFRKTGNELLGRITNLNAQQYQGVVELVLPADRSASSVAVNGEVVRDAQATTRFRRHALKFTAPVSGLGSLELRCAIA